MAERLGLLIGPRPGWILLLISLLAILLATPILVVLLSPLHTVAPHWDHVMHALLPSHLIETLRLLCGVLLLALVMAVPSAWLVTVHDFPFRDFFRWALVVPLALPTYISAFTFAALLGPTGSMSNWSAEHLGIRPDILTINGLSLVMALVLYPYIYLAARAAFSRGMTTQLDAARMLGAQPRSRFLRVALPLSRPAIVGGALLVAMETLNDFGAVKYFGVHTLTTGIFRSWGGLSDLGSALRLGIVLLVMVAMLLFIERRTRKGIRQTTDQLPAPPIPLKGPKAWLATAWCAILLLFAAALPLSKILIDILGSLDAPVITDLGKVLGNTLYVGILAAVVTLLIAVLFAFRERYGRGPNPAIRIADLGYAVPGAVIAIGVMAFAGVIDGQGFFRFALIGSTGLLIYAYSVRFLAVGTHPLNGALRQQDQALDDAARMLGASPWRAFTRVNLPLLRPALAAAAMLVTIDVIKELPLTLILRPFNFHTLSTWSYELASIEQLKDASWPALLIVICGLIPVLLLEKLLARQPR